MLDMFNALDMPVSVIANSAMYNYAPDLVTAYRARGNETLGHGRTNSERQSKLDRAAETERITEATHIWRNRKARPQRDGFLPGLQKPSRRRTCSGELATATR